MLRAHGRMRQDGLLVGDVVTGPGLSGPATIQSIGNGIVFVYPDGRVAGINAAEMAEFMPYYVLASPRTPIIPVVPTQPAVIIQPATEPPPPMPNDFPPVPVIAKPSGFKLSIPLVVIGLIVAFVVFKK